MVDRERRQAAAAASGNLAVWISETLGPRAQNGHAFAVGACVELRQGQNGPWQRGQVYVSDDPTTALVFMDGVLKNVNLEECEARLAPALAPAARKFAGGCDSGASEACFETNADALADRLAAVDHEWDWRPLATLLSGSAAPPVVAEEPAANAEAHAAAASEEPAAAPAAMARAAAAAKARADAAAEGLTLVPISRKLRGTRRSSGVSSHAQNTTVSNTINTGGGFSQVATQFNFRGSDKVLTRSQRRRILGPTGHSA